MFSGDQLFEFKTMYWNSESGVRQCDNRHFGCNDLDSPGKAAALRAQIKAFDENSDRSRRDLTDTEFYNLFMRIRAHAQTYSWMEDGHRFTYFLRREDVLYNKAATCNCPLKNDSQWA